jgi:hypothetical protein
MGGWAVFKVSDPSLLDEMKNGKEPIRGNVQLRDYLDHISSFEFDGSTSKGPMTDTYVPGASK